MEYLAQPHVRGLEVDDLFQDVTWRFGQRHGGQNPEVLVQGVQRGRFYFLPPSPSGAMPSPVAPAPPPLPPAPAILACHLQVNVNVAANVSLDGRPVGHAEPGKLPNLPVGAHKVTLDASGYKRKTEIHKVQPNRWTQAIVTLDPKRVAPLEPASQPAPTPTPAPPTEDGAAWRILCHPPSACTLTGTSQGNGRATLSITSGHLAIVPRSSKKSRTRRP